MKVLRRSDRIRIIVLDKEGKQLFAFLIAPLTVEQKSEIYACRKLSEGKMLQDGFAAMQLSVKYALKGLEGIEDSSGEPFVLEFTDESKNALTDASVSDILNFEKGGVLAVACGSLINGVFEKLVDSEGKELTGVEIEIQKGKK